MRASEISFLLNTPHLKPIPNDEKLLGIHTTTDQYGGFVSSPMISDVQDEAIRAELIERGLNKKTLNTSHRLCATNAMCSSPATKTRLSILTACGSINGFPTLRFGCPR